MLRKSKQIKLYIMNNLSVKYGTLDKNSPDVLFIRFKGKIIPTIIKNDYSKEIVELKTEFNSIVKNVILKYCDIFDCNRYLCNMEVSEKGITFKKGSYIKFDIFLKPNEIKDIILYKNIMEKIANEINYEIINTLNNLNLKYL